MLKTEYIQMKRNKFVSLVEILFPIVLLFLILLIRFLFKNEKEFYNDIYKNDAQFILKNAKVLSNYIKDNTISNLLLFGILIEVVLINPITYMVFKMPYNNYKTYGLNSNV